MSRLAIVSFNHAPVGHSTLKYERLGASSAYALALYCQRHDYALRNDVPDLAGKHACWAKIPALLAALEKHEIAAWVDSDALVINPERRIDAGLGADHDLAFQQPDRIYAALGLDPARGRHIQPVNTGVFIVRRRPWTVELLQRAYARAPASTSDLPWNGIGDQEAITAELASTSPLATRIFWVNGLQCLPQDPRPDAVFMHFYGDHASKRYPTAACREVLDAYAPKVCSLKTEPQKIALLHWCAIQNTQANTRANRGGPERFGYDCHMLDRALHDFAG